MQCFCKKSKSYNCRIVLLDEQEIIKEIQLQRTVVVWRDMKPGLFVSETTGFFPKLVKLLTSKEEVLLKFDPRHYYAERASHDVKIIYQFVNVQDNTKGQEILDAVFTHLNLLETAYFGLRYLDASSQTTVLVAVTSNPDKILVLQSNQYGHPKHWLDANKGVFKQLKGSDPFTLYFGVKFYAADPCKLFEEITRYQFFLQVKQDVLQGRLPVSFETAAELGAYAVQSEIGDYDPRRHSKGYVSEFRFTSNQSAELEARIEERHRELVGLLPAAAEYNYLEKVKWLEMYGVDLHPVLGEDNVEYFLGLTPSGIIVLRYKNKVGHYFWPRISKIYFKGKYFMIKICDRNNEETTYGFETPSKPACKHLWKCCVEHHAFFRLLQVSPLATDIFSLGSRFRYSGRTEKQAQADVQMQVRKPPNFLRTTSRRYQRRPVDNANEAFNVNCSSQKDSKIANQVKMISIPQPINLIYRSTNSIPAAAVSREAPESPRSTRSAPWSLAGNGRGLYSNTPKMSAGHRGCHSSQNLQRVSHRSPSVDSQSSNDSRHCKRHKRHRSRRSSDNESDLSKCSGRSHHRHRHGSHGNNDSDSVKNHKHRRKSRSSNRERYNLVDSEPQWIEIQKRKAEGGTGVQQATVNNISRTSGYLNSGMETESEKSYHYKRKQHKKHRSRSRSPSEFIKGRLPDEVKKHLEFNLIDTEGMSETQLRDIPYKVVQSNSIMKSPRKQSPNGKRKHHNKNVKRSSKPRKPEETNGENSTPQYSSSQNLPDSITPTAKRRPLMQIPPKDFNYCNNSDKV